MTRDGGASWQQAKEHNLPVVRKLLIGRGGLCVAVGDWSSIYLSNLFVSRDGGESWSPISSELVGNVIDLAGSIDDFIVLSDRGQLCRVRNQSGTDTGYHLVRCSRPTKIAWSGDNCYRAEMNGG